MKKAVTLLICMLFLAAPLIKVSADWGFIVYPPELIIPEIIPKEKEKVILIKKTKGGITQTPYSLIENVHSYIEMGVWSIHFLQPVGEVTITIVNTDTQEVMASDSGNTELNDTWSTLIIDWTEGNYTLTVENETSIYTGEFTIGQR